MFYREILQTKKQKVVNRIIVIIAIAGLIWLAIALDYGNKLATPMIAEIEGQSVEITIANTDGVEYTTNLFVQTAKRQLLTTYSPKLRIQGILEIPEDWRYVEIVNGNSFIAHTYDGEVFSFYSYQAKIDYPNVNEVSIEGFFFNK